MEKFISSILFTFLMFPLAVFSAEEKNGALKEYLHAVEHGDLSRLKSLLGPKFQYHYYEGNVLKILDRDAELRGLQKLFNEANIEMEERKQDDKIAGKSRVKFSVYFKDSPKDTKTFFWSHGFAMDQTLVVSLEKEKITQIVEMQKNGANSKLSFGLLKTLSSKETVFEYSENEIEGVFKLFDSRSHELLLWKKGNYSPPPRN